eukprot:9527779-Lingulodinium_polyedra.AAC.1
MVGAMRMPTQCRSQWFPWASCSALSSRPRLLRYSAAPVALERSATDGGRNPDKPARCRAALIR